MTGDLLGPAPPGRRWIHWAPVVAMMAVQVVLSSQSHLPAPLPPLSGIDKALHAGWFFLLGLLAYRAGRDAQGWPRRRTVVLIIFGALLWGISDEAHQAFVPGRDAEPADVAADVAGAAAAALIAEPLLRRLRLVSAPRPS